MNRSVFNPQRIVAICTAILAIPLECFVAFGFTFTFREHESFVAWLFVWTAFLLDVPALVIGVVAPKVGAWWVLANALVSLTIAIVFEVSAVLRPTAEASATNAVATVKLLFIFLVFWLPKFAYFWFCSRQVPAVTVEREAVTSR